MTCGLGFEQALGHSYERLSLMVREKKRGRAREIHRLGGLIWNAANQQAEKFNEAMRQLIDEINAETE